MGRPSRKKAGPSRRPHVPGFALARRQVQDFADRGLENRPDRGIEDGFVQVAGIGHHHGTGRVAGGSHPIDVSSRQLGGATASSSPVMAMTEVPFGSMDAAEVSEKTSGRLSSGKPVNAATSTPHAWRMACASCSRSGRPPRLTTSGIARACATDNTLAGGSRARAAAHSASCAPAECPTATTRRVSRRSAAARDASQSMAVPTS